MDFTVTSIFLIKRHGTMGLEDSSEDKKQVASGHDPRWKSELALKPFKSSIVGCEGKIFESDAVKNAA